LTICRSTCIGDQLRNVVANLRNGVIRGNRHRHYSLQHCTSQPTQSPTPMISCSDLHLNVAQYASRFGTRRDANLSVVTSQSRKLAL